MAQASPRFTIFVSENKAPSSVPSLSNRTIIMPFETQFEEDGPPDIEEDVPQLEFPYVSAVVTADLSYTNEYFDFSDEIQVANSTVLLYRSYMEHDAAEFRARGNDLTFDQFVTFLKRVVEEQKLIGEQSLYLHLIHRIELLYTRKELGINITTSRNVRTPEDNEILRSLFSPHDGRLSCLYQTELNLN